MPVLIRRHMKLAVVLVVCVSFAAGGLVLRVTWPATAQSPTPVGLVTMSSADTASVKAGGVLLEQPPAGAKPAVSTSAATAAAVARFGTSDKPVAVKEIILALKREVASPSSATLVWVVSLDVQPSFSSPAAKYLDPSTSYWLEFVDAQTGTDLGNIASSRLTPEGLKLQAEGKLPSWDDGNQIPAGTPLYQPTP